MSNLMIRFCLKCPYCGTERVFDRALQSVVEGVQEVERLHCWEEDGGCNQPFLAQIVLAQLNFVIEPRKVVDRLPEGLR